MGTGFAGYSGGDGGDATSATLYYPSGVAVDSNGRSHTLLLYCCIINSLPRLHVHR